MVAPLTVSQRIAFYRESVRLAARGRKYHYVRFALQQCRNLGARLIDCAACLQPVNVRTGGISKMSSEIRKHRVRDLRIHRCGSVIVKIKHRMETVTSAARRVKPLRLWYIHSILEDIADGAA